VFRQSASGHPLRTLGSTRSMCIVVPNLLGQHRQPVHPLAHIGGAASQPDPRTRRQADHPRRAASTRRKARASTCASTRSVVPVVRMISIRPVGGPARSGGGRRDQAAFGGVRRRPGCRHLNTGKAPKHRRRRSRLRRQQRLPPVVQLTGADAVLARHLGRRNAQLSTDAAVRRG
jgi:hypothetical protein